jgi:hypothetical protein
VKANIVEAPTNEMLMDLTRELARDNIAMRKLVLPFAGIDSTDGVTTMNWEERAKALEGLVEFFIQERKDTMKYIKLAKEVFKEGYMHNRGRHLLETMEKNYE